MMAVTDRLDDRAGAPDANVVRLPVELDLATVGDLRSAIAVAIRDGTGAVVLDCAPLTFIDASGIGTLVWSANAAAKAGRRVRLRNPGRTMCRMLLQTGVRRRFVVEAV